MMIEVFLFNRTIYEAITQRAASSAHFNVMKCFNIHFIFLLTLSMKKHLVPMKRTELPCFIFNVLEQWTKTAASAMIEERN